MSNYFDIQTLAKNLADLDVKSWQAHNNGQKAKNESIEYANYYSQFTELKSEVESKLFNLDLNQLKLSNEWQTKAAKYHDLAEEFQDRSLYTKAESYWIKVRECLNKKYLIFNLIKLGYEASAIQTVNEKGIESVDNGIKLKISDVELISNIQGTSETLRWKAHHIRDYKQFIYLSICLLESLGYSKESSVYGSYHLTEASKYHDLAEKNDIEDSIAKNFWKESFNNLIKYYEVLLKNKYV